MYTPEPKKPFFERIQERLAASRFLTFSALLHAILIFLGGGVVLYKQATDVPDFAASEGGLVSSDNTVQAPPEQPPDLTQQFTPQTPTLNAPTLSAISTTNVTTPTFQVASVVPVSAPVNDSMSKALASASQSLGKGVAGNGIPGTMSGRMGGTARATAMQMNGGKKESEEAVLRGLRWLVKNQNPDGSWGKAKGGPNVISAMTGFAVLSFLGHGETPVSAEFGPTVQKALDWVLTNGKKNDGHLCMTAAFSQQGVYAHAIVAYALGEYYTMTKDERVIDLLKKAIGYIVDGQGPDGGWMYTYDKTESDTSVSGWQIQALKAAHLSGLNIDGVDASLDKAMLDLRRVQAADGSFGYRNAKQAKYSLTGVGVLCTYFWKQEKDAMVKSGIEYIMKETTKEGGYPVKYKDDKADLYAWYYNTQACLMVGGAAWNTWNRLFQGELVKSQNPDGSWPPMPGRGVGDFQHDVEGNGPFYRTNFCILMLEVYYRYMPTTK